MGNNAWESFSEDAAGCLNGCLSGCENGCLGLIVILVALGMLLDAAGWVSGHPYVAAGIALAVLGGIIHLVRAARH